jgi:hypothetical protein
MAITSAAGIFSAKERCLRHEITKATGMAPA